MLHIVQRNVAWHFCAGHKLSTDDENSYILILILVRLCSFGWAVCIWLLAKQLIIMSPVRKLEGKNCPCPVFGRPLYAVDSAGGSVYPARSFKIVRCFWTNQIDWLIDWLIDFWSHEIWRNQIDYDRFVDNFFPWNLKNWKQILAKIDWLIITFWDWKCS